MPWKKGRFTIWVDDTITKPEEIKDGKRWG